VWLWLLGRGLSVRRGEWGRRQFCGAVCLVGRPGWDADRLVMSSLDDSYQGVWRRGVLERKPREAKEQERGLEAHSVWLVWLGTRQSPLCYESERGPEIDIFMSD
jgi:hypothetical protein